jgi:hypothetical protein
MDKKNHELQFTVKQKQFYVKYFVFGNNYIWFIENKKNIKGAFYAKTK